MASGRETIVFSESNSATILTALGGNGTVRFAITEMDNPTTKYILTIEDTTGISQFMPVESILSGFYDGLAWVYCGGNYGCIDISGNLVIPYKYAAAGIFSEGYASVANGEKWGFVDKTGKEVIPFIYDSVGSFGDGLCAVQQNGKYGFIDKNGTQAIPFKYDEARGSFATGPVAVRTGEYWELIDKQGNSVSEKIDFVPLPWMGDWPRPVRNGDKWGYVDNTGSFIIPCEYEDCGWFSEGIAQVNKGTKIGFINEANELVIPYEYDATYRTFSEGLISVQKDGKWGVIDKTGAVVIPLERNLAYGAFVNGRAIIYDGYGGRYGFVDMTGKLVIDYQFDQIYLDSFKEGIAIVKMNEKRGVIDTNGSFIIPCKYDSILYSEEYFVLLNNGFVEVVSRDEVQPNWREQLKAFEQELAAQEEERRALAEKQKLLKEYTDKATVKSVQAALNDAGFPCGTPDGAAGKKTKAALSDYQTAKSLTVTGTITHETLISMGLAN